MWALFDFVVDATLLSAEVKELTVVAAIEELPGAVKSLKDLFNVVKIAWIVVSAPMAISTRPVDTARSILDAVKKTSVKISSAQYKDVHNDNLWDTYLSVDGITSLLGTKTESVLVMYGDGYLA